MNRFNLTFWGEILAGRDPRKVKARFAKMFSIDDPERLDHFFSGDTITLRRNLERKVAAEYYSKLRKLGVEVKLVKVETAAAENAETDWEAARRQAELEAQQRKAQRAAEREEARKRAEAAAARRRAEREALKRQQAEAEARRKEQEEARRREQAEAEARHRAELEARRQQQAQEAAERKAAREAEQRRAAEEAARRKAELDEEKRLAREQAEAEKARLAEEKRQAAEALAKQKALEAEQKRLEEERRREQAAREKAEREAEAARLRQEKEAARQEEKARREAERARVAEERARQRAERERQQAEEKRRAEQERRAEEERLREQEAQRKLMEEQAIARAAEELSDMSALKQPQDKVTTSLDLPRRESLPPKTKRQAGAPNFYSTHPFRNTAEVRERAAIAAKKKFTGLVIAAVAIAGLMILSGRYLERVPVVPVTGPTAVAVTPGGSLTILARDRLLTHDRAGVGTGAVALGEMGIPAAVKPMAYDAAGELILYASPGDGLEAFTQLHRCSSDLASCNPVPVEGRAAALATHPLTRELFLAGDSTLSKLSPGGELLATAELPLPDQPVMFLDSGLLFINSSRGPAISVYRYEDQAFGRQLDEILLLPPPANAREQTRVRDFTLAGDTWWVSLANPESGDTGIYLFDKDWNYLREVSPGAEWTRAGLLSWGRKVLLWRADSATLKRFAGSGQAEADLRSDMLDSLITTQRGSARLESLAWAAGFAILAAIAMVAAALGYHQYLRSLVYHSRPTSGAEPIDEHTENISWIDPAAEREAAVRRLWLKGGAVALGVVLLCIGLGASVAQLTAALIALAGPAIALLLFGRSQPGHVGTLEDRLVLVDHRQMYHVATGSRIQYRGAFLLIDDVAVFAGTKNLPALSRKQLNSSVTQVVKAGARVDRKTVLVKLLEARHPLARGATAIGGALTAALIVLVGAQFL